MIRLVFDNGKDVRTGAGEGVAGSDARILLIVFFRSFRDVDVALNEFDTSGIGSKGEESGICSGSRVIIRPSRIQKRQ